MIEARIKEKAREGKPRIMEVSKIGLMQETELLSGVKDCG